MSSEFAADKVSAAPEVSDRALAAQVYIPALLRAAECPHGHFGGGRVLRAQAAITINLFKEKQASKGGRAKTAMTQLHFAGKGVGNEESCVLNDEGKVVARFYGPDAESHACWEVRRRDGTVGRLALASCWLIAASSFLFLCGSHYARNDSVFIATLFTGALLAAAVTFFGYHCYLAGRRKELSARSIQLVLTSSQSGSCAELP